MSSPVSTSADALECLLQSRELFRAATKLAEAEGGRPEFIRITALLGALAMAIADSSDASGALDVSIILLAATRLSMPALRAQAVDASLNLGGIPS